MSILNKIMAVAAFSAIALGAATSAKACDDYTGVENVGRNVAVIEIVGRGNYVSAVQDGYGNWLQVEIHGNCTAVIVSQGGYWNKANVRVLGYGGKVAAILSGSATAEVEQLGDGDVFIAANCGPTGVYNENGGQIIVRKNCHLR